MLWRLRFSQPRLLDIDVDDEVRLLLRMQRQVQRDTYRMKAFVRFRQVTDAAEEHYVAWREPDPDVLPLATPFFVERFATMRWSIMTPDRSAHWDGKTLHFGPGIAEHDTPGDDTLDDVWRTYYATTFDRARINPVAMQTQSPSRFWKSLPESRLIMPLRQGERERGRQGAGAGTRASDVGG